LKNHNYSKQLTKKAENIHLFNKLIYRLSSRPCVDVRQEGVDHVAVEKNDPPSTDDPDSVQTGQLPRKSLFRQSEQVNQVFSHRKRFHDNVHL